MDTQSVKVMRELYVGTKILYAEDDLAFQKSVLHFFSHLFFDVTMCNNGKEALAAYADHPYDLVITDILMHQMNGIALIAEVKRINPNQKIMVISGSLNSPYTEQLAALGVTDLLSKPFTIENFLKSLQNCLEKKISPDQSTEYQRCNR